MSTMTIMDLKFIRDIENSQECYQVLLESNTIGSCYLDRGTFFVKDASGLQLYAGIAQGQTDLIESERLFFMMHAGHTLKNHLKGSQGINWNAPLRFRDAENDSITILDTHLDPRTHTTHVMVEYPHPTNGKAIVDTWAYDPSNGRPLNPMLRLNPLRRFDLTNKN